MTMAAPTAGRRPRGWWRPGLIVPVTLLCAVSAWADRISLSTGPFVVTCSSAGQVCDPPVTMAVGDPGRPVTLRKIVYTAAAEHCSAGRLLVDLDGRQVTKLRFVVGRERTSRRRRLRLSPGSHTLAFRLEGKVGGCNVGYVASWGGEITLTGRR